MTSISSLLGRMPSLADYLDTKSNGTAANTTGITPLHPAGTPSLADYLGADADTVSFSPQAQSLLASQTSAISSFTPDADGGAAAKDGAIAFIAKFFTDSGVTVDGLSGEAQKLLSGIADLIESMGDVSRDSTLDQMAESYSKDQRGMFSLQAEGARLSATVQYEEGGTPKTLTITQVQGTAANTATITLSRNAAGDLSGIDVSRVQREYNSHGGLVATNAADPLSLPLYA